MGVAPPSDAPSAGLAPPFVKVVPSDAPSAGLAPPFVKVAFNNYLPNMRRTLLLLHLCRCMGLHKQRTTMDMKSPSAGEF